MPSAQSAAEVLASLQQLRLALELRARARLQQISLELHERARRAAERICAVPWEDAVDRIRPVSRRALAACSVSSASITALTTFAAILAFTAGGLIVRPRATFCELLGTARRRLHRRRRPAFRPLPGRAGTRAPSGEEGRRHARQGGGGKAVSRRTRRARSDGDGARDAAMGVRLVRDDARGEELPAGAVLRARWVGGEVIRACDVLAYLIENLC